jgi:hypothetical protein
MAAQSPKNQGGFLEGLASTMGQLASLSVLPDAQQHVPFVNELMKAIQGYLHHPNVGGKALGQQQGQQGPQALGAGGGGQPSVDATQQGTPGVGQGAQMPNPDELRRMLGANAQAA